MITEIQNVQQYFKDELLAGRFEPVEFEASFTIVAIDIYEFCIWNGEIKPKYCKPWNSIGRSFMQLPEFTEQESEQLFVHLNACIIANNERIRIEKIAKLEAELLKLKI